MTTDNSAFDFGYSNIGTGSGSTQGNVGIGAFLPAPTLKKHASAFLAADSVFFDGRKYRQENKKSKTGGAG